MLGTLAPGGFDRTIGMQASWYLQFVLTTLVLAFPGIRFYEKETNGGSRGIF